MLTSNSTDLVRKDSIEELCGHRERALQLYQQAVATLRAAQDAHKRACGGSPYVSNEFLRDIGYAGLDSGFGARVQIEIDRDIWRYLIIGTPLGSLMDAAEKKRFEESLRKEPPDVTADNVFATMSRLAGDAGAIFRRGLVNAFRGFCDGYKSHDGFKIGQRFIIPHLCDTFGISHWRVDGVMDIDRCMHVLDGKPSPDYQQGVCAALRSAIRDKAEEATTEYWKVRIFRGNGNAHFYPLRADLVTKANKMIAEHFGDVLGAAPAARHR